jgi:nucleoid-associated protein YgaU
MIESRYTIEYVNPEKKEVLGTKKPIALFILIGFILTIALAYAFISLTETTDFVRVFEKTQNQTTTITNESSEQENKPVPTSLIKKQEVMPIPNTVNGNTNKLNESIDKLTKQLMAEREKNKTLDKQLNSQKNQNNQLSELLESALSKASSADKNYLKALNTLEKQTLDIMPSVVQKIKVTKEVDTTFKITAPKTERSINNNGGYNSINLSTNSQVDAIIAAMQGNQTSPSKVIKNNVDKTNEVQLVSVRQSSPTELLHIQLQKQINQLIENNNSNPISNKVYTSALEKESKVRKNAVRSIIIKKGETLWEIAQRAYGNGSLYKKIIKANPQIDINKLYIGQVVRVPN